MGAERLNAAVLKLMRDFTSKHPEVLHLHATGAIEKELCGGWFKEMGLDRYENIKLVEYIYDMPYQMAAADVTICRAGAMTISELANGGKCAVFIPSPNVTDNHQYKNAKVLVDAGAAMLFEEKELETTEAAPLTETVAHLLSDEGFEKRRAMETAIRAFAVPDANKKIYLDLIRLVKNKQK
jgi:UDP-N-acetylglucosamine--N-acetylmuramyl-(pentapeptide) pyrophosphoryl-undecaprenol N-acetylglucosamine transferase